MTFPRYAILAAAILLLFGVPPAPGDIVTYYADADAASTGFVRAGLGEPPSPAGPGVTTIYDNYTGPGSGGRTVRRGEFSTGDHSIRDDLIATVELSRLSAYVIVFANQSSTGRLSRFSYELSFTRLDGSLIVSTAFTVDLSIFPLPENSVGALLWPDGSFLSLNAILPQSFNVHERLFDPVGIATEELGMSYGGPRTLGESEAGVFDETLGIALDFGDDSTLRFRLRAEPVPSPGGVAIILGALLLRHRRRKPSSGWRKVLPRRLRRSTSIRGSRCT